MRMLVIAVVCATCFGLGVLVDRSLGGPGRASAALDVRVLDAKLESLRAGLDGHIDRACLAPGAAAIPNAIESVENVAAFHDARRLVESARRGGKWTEDDAAHLSKLMPVMNDVQRDEVLRALSVAINEQRVHLAYQGGLYR